MKKLLFIAAIAIVGLSSCKKDYTCTCVVAGQTIVLPLQDQTKKDAESGCDALEITYSNAGDATCTLD